ncbi:uncharacterized protein LOC119662914 [Teleopsis dalmanni]|uniref:uncharacterized protein LOC119662914 n=1 Tax=Teleopsis dalmanni TaxID=139649 RepID=UPI0018CFD751|nr:uncharacterized protein LOC119662914 [Teleopsis dalmanni]
MILATLVQDVESTINVQCMGPNPEPETVTKKPSSTVTSFLNSPITSLDPGPCAVATFVKPAKPKAQTRTAPSQIIVQMDEEPTSSVLQYVNITNQDSHNNHVAIDRPETLKNIKISNPLFNINKPQGIYV